MRFLFLFILILILSCTSGVQRRKIEIPAEPLPEEERWVEKLREEPLTFNVFGIPVPKRKKEVRQWIQYLAKRERVFLQRSLRRAQRYLPIVKKILGEFGLPEALAYLPIIESGYNPYSRSRKGAVGIWQFIKGTARKYGLRVDWWVDERRDPIESTKAAARYLRDLYELFGDWELALASYNLGEGKVLRRIWQKATWDFWRLKIHFPKETRDYVPLFYAVLLIVSDPSRYGIVVDTNGLRKFEFDSLWIPRPVELSMVAKWAGTSLKRIKELNPQFLREFTPPGMKNFLIRVPKGTGEIAYIRMSKTPREKWLSHFTHRVRRGETLWTLSKRYGVPVSVIRRANNLRNPNKIRAGQLLIIPRVGGEYYALGKDFEYHRVRRGECLSLIARKYKVSIRAIKKANRLKSDRIYAGQILRIPLRKRSFSYFTYRIKRGDTLYSIARRFGTNVALLKEVNNIKNPKRLIPGRKIKIPKKSS